MAAMLVLLAAAANVHAGEVKLRHGGRTFDGELTGGLRDTVVLLTHGTLQHNRTELMRAIQDGLGKHAIASLAITLSLGVDDRKGPLDCGVPHGHKHSDAPGEIAAWVSWLEEKGARRIVVAGHSRGAAQTALFAAETSSPAVAGIVLIAPALAKAGHAAVSYEGAHGRALAPLVAEARALVDAGRGGEELTGIPFQYCREARVAAASFLDYYGAEREGTPAILGRIGKPTLVVAAGADRLFPDLARDAEPYAASGRLKLATVEGADHFFQDLFADDLVDAVADFVRAL